MPITYRRLTCASLLSLACLDAAAQVPSITRDTAAPEQQLGPKPPAGFQLDAPVIPPALESMGTVTITRFRFDGLTAFDAEELAAVAAPWTGKSLSAADVSELLKAVTAYLRDRGLYAAFARFPDQKIADGEGVIEIVEGRLGSVDIQQDSPARLRPAIARGFLGPLQPGTLIRRGTLDTPLLLLNDLPGVRVEPSLAAASTPGTADLTVKIADEPLFAGFVRADNHQVRELGEVQFTGHVRLRNPLGIGDLATAEGVRSHTGGWTRGTLTYSAPINYLGTRAGVLFSNQRYRLGGDFEPLLSNGDSKRISAVIAHPFIRQDNRNLTGSLSLNGIRYADRVDLSSISTESRHRFATLRLGGDQVDGWLGGGINAFYVEYQSGRVTLDTPAAAAFDAATLDVAGRFSRGRIHFDRTQRLWANANLFVSWTGQIASKNLDQGREILLSGPDAVRAYPAGELVADEGHLTTVEYRHLVPLGGAWRSIVALFVDSAHGRVNANPLPGSVGNSRDIWGYGVSLTVTWRDSLSANLMAAWRGSEAPLTDPGRNPRIWFSLTQLF